ncbi:MAG: hypothetical protein J6S14_02300 [Clostridia bacterium]|nr:hypothetical protein [Clostridia bacterium]
MPEYTDCVNQKIKGGAVSICPTCIHRNVCKVIKNQPCIECSEFIRAVVVKGKWELDSDGLPVCSECGEIALQRIFVKVPHLIQEVRMVRSSYCPNCGADMKGKADV